LLNAIKPPVAPVNTLNIYELRNYRAKPGAAKEWLDLFTSALQHREKYCKIVGLWQTEAGQSNGRFCYQQTMPVHPLRGISQCLRH
jgi:hypothetical protein